MDKKGNGIPAHKIGKLWKFKKSELDNWVKSGESANNVIGIGDGYVKSI